MTKPAAVISVEPKTHLDKAASDAALQKGGAAIPATTATAGLVKQMPFSAQLAGGADLPTTVTAFNALLTKLIAAGLMAAA